MVRWAHFIYTYLCNGNIPSLSNRTTLSVLCPPSLQRAALRAEIHVTKEVP
jgi:hypothetical protein